MSARAQLERDAALEAARSTYATELQEEAERKAKDEAELKTKEEVEQKCTAKEEAECMDKEAAVRGCHAGGGSPLQSTCSGALGGVHSALWRGR